MKRSELETVKHNGKEYTVLKFVCPGCAQMTGNSGLHMLPVNTDVVNPSWEWDGDLERPTINPSIMTGRGTDKVCHSWLHGGVFQYLNDSTHALAGQHVEMVDLPGWAINERD